MIKRGSAKSKRSTGQRRCRLRAHFWLGAVYGAAAGTVIGFVVLAFAPAEAGTEVARWRTFILGGAVVGAVGHVVLRAFVSWIRSNR